MSRNLAANFAAPALLFVSIAVVGRDDLPWWVWLINAAVFPLALRWFIVLVLSQERNKASL